MTNPHVANTQCLDNLGRVVLVLSANETSRLLRLLRKGYVAIETRDPVTGDVADFEEFEVSRIVR